jgi:DNA polymerase III subunit delta'
VTGFVSITDQAQPIRTLEAFWETGKIPHAMLFTGIDGIGKRSIAKVFAALCNCPNPKVRPRQAVIGRPGTGPSTEEATSYKEPCGQCRSCRKIFTDCHPDFLRIEPEGKFIRIGQIRELLGILAKKPFEALCRVVVISNAHTMNSEAGNALLKVLEEPPASTVLILTASGTAELLPTIVSRCQQIRFNPLPISLLSRLLAEREGVSSEKTFFAAAMANGSYGRAVEICRGGLIEKRNRMIQASGLLELSSSQRVSISELMGLALEWVESNDSAQDALDLLTGLYRDLAIIKFSPGPLMNEDLRERIGLVADNMTQHQVVHGFEMIELTRKRLWQNANPRLNIELLLLQLLGYLPEPIRNAANA